MDIATQNVLGKLIRVREHAFPVTQTGDMKQNNIDLMIVDDDEAFRATVVRRFSRRGFNVSEASNAAEAMSLAAARQFDVAVFDMVMPGMTGLELLGNLKAGHAEFEIILLTGQGSIESAVRAMNTVLEASRASWAEKGEADHAQQIQLFQKSINDKGEEARVELGILCPHFMVVKPYNKQHRKLEIIYDFLWCR